MGKSKQRGTQPFNASPEPKLKYKPAAKLPRKGTCPIPSPNAAFSASSMPKLAFVPPKAMAAHPREISADASSITSRLRHAWRVSCGVHVANGLAGVDLHVETVSFCTNSATCNHVRATCMTTCQTSGHRCPNRRHSTCHMILQGLSGSCCENLCSEKVFKS